MRQRHGSHSATVTPLDFDTEYGRLNESQKKAVDTIEGPVMVVAGPGTGKTQVVALRVANILKKTHMRPSNVLCLTFSVSGATAMRERLRRLIGPAAYGVTVTTIHGFCNDVIRDHPEVFHDFGTLEPVTDVQRFHLMNAIIDELSPDAVIVNPKDRHGRAPAILARISELKREAVSLEDLEKRVTTYDAEMETKSKPGTKVHQRNLRLARQFREFVSIMRSYKARLEEEGLYDYEDMIRFVTAALREEDWLLAGLQERYQYVLVDEYQDTNGSQNEVIETLTTLPAALGHDPNLFVVGDDDQAIYRFQGANVKNMLQFRERFPNCPVITLSVSYRSTQQVLDAASSLITNNADRLVGKIEGLEKTMTAGGKEKEGPSPILIRPVSDAAEPFAIAERVRGWIDEGVHPTEIAVFTRTNRELFPLYDALVGREIPAQITGKLDLLRHPAVLQCLAMLRALAAMQTDGHLAAAMAAACMDCHPADLGQLWTHQKQENANRPEGQPRLSLYDVLTRLETLMEIGTPPFRKPERLLKSRDLLFELSNRLASSTLPETLEELMRRSGLIPEKKDDADPISLTALSEFFAHVKNRCHEGNFGIRELLADLESREQYGLRLSYDVPHLVDEGVQLMTAHASKGLEFEAVIIADFREKHWDHKRGSPGLALPEGLLSGSDDEEDMALQDERRLAYVAWTRAKKHLVLSCPERVTRGEREQDVSPSQFFSEGNIPERHEDLASAEAANALLLETPEIDDALGAFLREKLKTFELSVTALNRFLGDPMAFFWEDLLAIPKAKKTELAYGSAIHAALQEWGRAMKAGEECGLPKMLEVFERAMREEEIVPLPELEPQIHLGKQTLERYYPLRLVDRPIVKDIERRLSGRLEGDIRLKGLVDRVDLYHETGAAIRVIDYKTGRPKTDKQVREDYGGSTYRQLVFYKLLIGISPAMAGYDPVEFSLDFVGEREEEPKLLTFEIPDADVRALESLIRIVWSKILALDFTPLQRPPFAD